MTFPDDSPVEVRYPLDGTPTKTSAGTTVYISDVPRESWPWLPGVIEQQCGPDEWQVTVLARQVATAGRYARARRHPGGAAVLPVLFPGRLRTAPAGHRTGGRAVTSMAAPPDPPDPRFPVYDPHPHPLDLLACWLFPALWDPHWSTAPRIRDPEAEASL